MLNKIKISDLFLRKESHGRREEVHRPTSFDESYLHCRLRHNGLNSDLVRLECSVRESGQSLDQLKCKWYLRNSHDFKEVRDVSAAYYQPCLDDVGYIICVQVEPFLEGMRYTGITMMYETEPVKLDPELEHRLDGILNGAPLHLRGRIQSIFSQQSSYQELDLPLDVQMTILSGRIILTDEQTKSTIGMYDITQEHPQLDFIRKSFNSVLFNFNDQESMKLSFLNNFDRDLFVLVVRSYVANAIKVDHLGARSDSAQSKQVEQTEVKERQEIHVENGIQEGRQKEQNIIKNGDASGNTERKMGLIEKGDAVEDTKGEIPMERSEEAGSPKVILSSCTSSSWESNCPAENGSEQLKYFIGDSEQAEVNPEDRLGHGDHYEALLVQGSVQRAASNTLLVLKLDEKAKQFRTLKHQWAQLLVNYDLERSSKNDLQSQLDSLKAAHCRLQEQHEQCLKLAAANRQLLEDNRYCRNEISMLKQEHKQLERERDELGTRLQANNRQRTASQASISEEANRKVGLLERLLQEKEVERLETETLLERMKAKVQILENQNAMLKKKLDSVIGEKGIAIRLIEGSAKGNINSEQEMAQKEKQIESLECKLYSLELLLRYMQGNERHENSDMHAIINRLTETITEKELQLHEFKKINKELLQQRLKGGSGDNKDGSD